MKSLRQRGIVMVTVAIALVALLALGALALDGAHLVLNKSRLQSTLDAAALAAAKTLEQTTSTVLATAAANSVFTLNVAQYPELSRAGLALTTQYSNTLNPFAPGTTPAKFVRTQITGFPTTMTFAGVMGINSINIGGNAVAGPSAPLVTACNLTPIMMCGAPGAAPLYGYTVNQIVGLLDNGNIGPGNFGLLSLGGPGGAVLRTNLAGGYQGCATIGQTVTTQPGQAVGPVSQGLNVRFDDYGGPMHGDQATYPPDVIGCPTPTSCTNSETNLTWNGTNVTQGNTVVTDASQITQNYAAYQARVAAGSYDNAPVSSGGIGEFNRRVVAVPIGDCTGGANGRSSLPVLGFACIFLLQPYNGQIFAQVISGCNVNGQVGTGTGSGSNPHKIVLYKSAGSPDS